MKGLVRVNTIGSVTLFKKARIVTGDLYISDLWSIWIDSLEDYWCLYNSGDPFGHFDRFRGDTLVS